MVWKRVLVTFSLLGFLFSGLGSPLWARTQDTGPVTFLKTVPTKVKTQAKDLAPLPAAFWARLVEFFSHLFPGNSLFLSPTRGGVDGGLALGISSLDVAYQPSDNFYFLVWSSASEKDGRQYSEIRGQVRDATGNIIEGGDEGFLISQFFSTTRCLPEDFFRRFYHPDIDFEASSFQHPNECDIDLSPAVAYNTASNVFRVVWQRVLQNKEDPAREFSVILARDYQISLSSGSVTLTELSSFPQLVNRYYFMWNAPDHCPDGTPRSSGPCEEKFILDDGDILAWSTARSPSLETSPQGDYFILAYETNVPAFGRGEVQGQGPAAGGWTNTAELMARLEDYGIQIRPLREIRPPYPEPYTYHDSAERLAVMQDRPQLACSSTSGNCVVVYTVLDRLTNNRGIQSLSLTISDDLTITAREPHAITGLEGEGAQEEQPAVTAHTGEGTGEFLVPFLFEEGPISGIRAGLLSGTGGRIDWLGNSWLDLDITTESVTDFEKRRGVKVDFTHGLSDDEKRHLLVYEQGGKIYGLMLSEDLMNFHPFEIFSESSASVRSSPAVIYNSHDQTFYTAWLSLAAETTRVENALITLDSPQGTFVVTPGSDPVHIDTEIRLSWEFTNIRPDDFVTIEATGLPGTSPFVDEAGEPLRLQTTDEFLLTEGLPGYGEVSFTLTLHWWGGERVMMESITVEAYRDPIINDMVVYRPDDPTRTPLEEVWPGEEVRIEWAIDFEMGDFTNIRLIKVFEGSSEEVVIDNSLSQEGFIDDVVSFQEGVGVTYRLLATGSSGETIVRDFLLRTRVFNEPVINTFWPSLLDAEEMLTEAVVGDVIQLHWEVQLDPEEVGLVDIRLLKIVGGEETVLADHLSPTGTRNDFISEEAGTTILYRLSITDNEGIERSEDLALDVFLFSKPGLVLMPSIIAPTRAFLRWSVRVGGDEIPEYDLYFVQTDGEIIPEGVLPYHSHLSELYFTIQSDTDHHPDYAADAGVTPLFLESGQRYCWQVTAYVASGSSLESDVNCFETSASLVGWWRLDMEEGQDVVDSGGGHNGILGGTSEVQNSDPLWDMTEAGSGVLYFDGEDDYVLIPDNNLITGDRMTVSFWMKSGTDQRDWVGVVGQEEDTGSSSSWGAHRSSSTSDLGFFIHTEANLVTLEAIGVFDDRWHFIACTYDGSVVRLYLDGALVNMRGLTGRVVSSADYFLFGTYDKNGDGSDLSSRAYRGFLRDVMISDRSMDEEINQNYMAGASLLNIF